jgi:hypothetical protein
VVKSLEAPNLTIGFLTNPVTSHKSWTRAKVVSAVFILAAVVFSSYFQSIKRNAEVISPIDEWSYVDSLFQSRDFGIVRPGEEVSLEGKRYIACQDIWGVGRLGAGCESLSQPNSAWPLEGKSPAEIHPPIYFVLTAVTADFVQALPIEMSFVDAGRFIGAVWMLLGLFVWMFIYRSIGVSLWAALPISILVALSPLAISTNTFLTPDATFALSSGVVALLAIKYMRGEVNFIWLIFAGVFPVLFKVTHLLTGFQFAILLLSVAFLAKSISKQKALVGAVSLISGTVVGLVAWQLTRALARVATSPVHPEAEPVIALRNFVALFGYHFSVLPQSSTSPIPAPWLSTHSASLFSLLLAAASIGGFLYSRRDSEFFSVALVSSASIYFGAAALSLITFLIAGGFLVATARYGLPLLLLWTIPLAIASSRRLGIGILGVITLVSYYAILTGNV